MTAAVAGPAAVWAALVFGLLGVLTGRRRFLVISAGLAVSATLVLTVALLTSDFSLEYVAETTSVATPWPYRLAALWGGMEGSMLFYTTITLVIVTAALRRGGETRVGALATVGLLAVTLGFADPFATLAVPAIDGRGLLAILQHPAMIYHPPILYLGLAVLLVPFAITLAAGEPGDPGRRRRVRRWLYVSWTLLTAGMVAGANWAYVELGWGGFWAWDPVENTALMPWLAVTAHMHVSRVTSATGRLRRSTVALATIPFALSVVGVYLTRSGVTGSIHSFAEDPVVGRVLLFAAAAAAAAAALTALRTERGAAWGRVHLDRHAWMALSSALLSIALVFVVVGTVYPAALSVFTGDTVLVEPRFFAMTTLPLALALLPAMAFSLGIDARLWAAATVMGGGVALAVDPRPAALLAGVAGGTLVAVVFRGVRLRPSGRALVAHTAHAGIALLLLGVAGSAYGSEISVTMRPGDTVRLGGHEIVLQSVETGEVDRFLYARATLIVDGRPMLPEIRAYEGQATPVAEPRLRSTPVEDVIVMISLLFPDAETVEVSVLVRPLVWWVWVGGALVAIGGLLALFVSSADGEGRRRWARSGRRPAGTTSGSAAR